MTREEFAKFMHPRIGAGRGWDDVVEYILTLENRNKRLTEAVKDLDTRLTNVCNPPRRGTYE